MFQRVSKTHEYIRRLDYGRTLLDIYADRPLEEVGRRTLVALVAQYGGQQRAQIWFDSTGSVDAKAFEIFGHL